MTGLGRHAATDGSFGKSAGSALFRGAGLVGLAVILGLIMLYWGTRDSSDGALDVSAVDESADVTADDGEGNGDDDAAGAGDDDNAEAGGDTDADDGTDAPPTTDTTAPVVEEEEEEDDASVDPSEVLVIAANAVGTPGLAGALRDDLTVMNYQVDAANAPNSSISRVYFKQGFRANAREIVDNLGKDPSIIQRLPNDGSVTISNDADGARLAAAQIIIIIGSDDIF